MDIFLQQIINGLVQGSIYALVALGYTMVYGIMGLINFAHGEVVMIGTLVTITVAGSLINAGMPVLFAGLAGLGVSVLICMALGWGLERIAYSHRYVHRAAKPGHDDLGAQLPDLSASAAEDQF